MAHAAPILWDVVEEHLDEASFLGSQWRAAMSSPRRTLTEVARNLEPRLEANLDALGAPGNEVVGLLLVPGLRGDDTGAAFAAALALLRVPGRDRVAEVAEAAAGSKGPKGAAVAWALGLGAPAGRDVDLLALARDPVHPGAASALDALTLRRITVPADLVAAAASSTSPALAAAGLRAARPGPGSNATLVERALQSRATEVRDAALETGLRLGLRSAWVACRKIVESRGPAAGTPALLLALGGEPEDVERIVALLTEKPARADAVIALGFTGRLSAVDACVALLDDKALGPLAGEAVSAITGLVMGEGYRMEPPEEDEPMSFADENLDADLVSGAAAELPVPIGGAVAAWWEFHRSRFDPSQRYLDGRPWTPAGLRGALETGPMRRRHALGLDLAIRSRGSLALETRAWASDQRSQLASMGGALREELGHPYGRLLRG
jgi:uncharacterized protein (TIGR02270 family)